MISKPISQQIQIITDLIEKRLGLIAVKSTITDHIPAYPYVSFTVMNVNYRKGTYGRESDETRFLPVTIPISFTVQSDKDTECWEKVQALRDLFVQGTELADLGVIVGDVGSITARDNILTVEYEYRKGFDVTINALDIINQSDGVDGYIDTVATVKE